MMKINIESGCKMREPKFERYWQECRRNAKRNKRLRNKLWKKEAAEISRIIIQIEMERRQ